MTKREHILLLFVALIFSMYISPHADEDTLILDEWATVTSVIGNAEVRSFETEKWRPVHVGMRIKMTWDVRTHNESSVELAFESGTEIKLSENSEVKLATFYSEKHTDVTGITDKTEKQ